MLCVGHCSDMHFQAAAQAPGSREHAKAKRGGTGGALRGAADPHATCEPGKTTLTTQARQVRRKHCWGEGKTSVETRNFNRPAACQAPLSRWLCPQRKCTAAIKHCVCARLSAGVRALSGTGVSGSFRSLFKRSQTGEPFLCCYNRDEETRGKGQKGCPDP